MLRLALASIALVGLVAEPAFARMMTSSSFASRGMTVAPRTSIGTLKSFNAPGGLTTGHARSTGQQSKPVARYHIENAWPTKGGAHSRPAGTGNGLLLPAVKSAGPSTDHGLLLPAVKSAGPTTDTGLLLPAVQAAREAARAK